MNDKRFLFRGFHPDENGKTTITLPKVSEQEIAEVERKLKIALDEFNLTYAAKLNDKLHSLKAERNVKVKGEWKYWTVLGHLVHGDKFQYSSGGIVSEIEILQETIGQWVKTDKNGKDIFEGDQVFSFDCPARGFVFLDSRPDHMTYRVGASEEDEDAVGLFNAKDWELIGNKWEIEDNE
ncbi:MAG: hypothetical protein J1E81_06095 [Eubacterium sp.]|nr:hypothetical protein [Eubacterium sp.]